MNHFESFKYQMKHNSGIGKGIGIKHAKLLNVLVQTQATMSYLGYDHHTKTIR